MEPEPRLGWRRSRNDLEFSAKPGAIDVSRTVNNTSLTADPTAPIPYALELAEVAGWEQKVLTNNKVIGPRAVLIQQATSRINLRITIKCSVLITTDLGSVT